MRIQKKTFLKSGAHVGKLQVVKIEYCVNETMQRVGTAMTTPLWSPLGIRR